MSRISILMVMLVCVSLRLDCADQLGHADSAQNPDAKDRQSVPLPDRATIFTPKLTLQQALKIAEDYVDREHIDIRSYWLYRAIYILYGDEKTPREKKVPAWHFWWVSEKGVSGDDVEILVYMDGKAYRAPSM